MKGKFMDGQQLHKQPMPQARRVPRLKILRRRLALSQEAFAARYMLPLGRLRDWEQGVREPDGTGHADVRAIIGDPEGVALALRKSGPDKVV